MVSIHIYRAGGAGRDLTRGARRISRRISSRISSGISSGIGRPVLHCYSFDRLGWVSSGRVGGFSLSVFSFFVLRLFLGQRSAPPLF